MERSNIVRIKTQNQNIIYLDKNVKIYNVDFLRRIINLKM